LGNKICWIWETKIAEFGKRKRLTVRNKKADFGKQNCWIWETKSLTLGNKKADFGILKLH
jgi:hypothetical protein